MDHVVGYRCIHCGTGYPLQDVLYACPGCHGNLQVRYDYGQVADRWHRRTDREAQDPTLWRYRALLPVGDNPARPIVHAGWTPLYHARRLGRSMGLSGLYVKDDGRNPSASFKDRASAVVLARAEAIDRRTITAASTGNAAASLVAMASGRPIECVIFVPATAPQAKLAQLMVYGARLVTVDGTYDQAFDLSMRATEIYGWYNRNTGYNPFTREGKKTAAYEIWEQLGWRIPDRVFVPVGDGNIISGVWKGFVDLKEAGLVDRTPALVACQATGSDSVKRAFERGSAPEAVSGETVADSISVQTPRDGEAAVQALRESGGTALSVEDGAILDAIPRLARETGVFAEPAAAVVLACLATAIERGVVDPQETVVLLITGNGLKDIGAVTRTMAEPIRIAPRADELRRIVDEGLL